MATADPKDNEQTGTVKWFNDQKGYGFISRDDNRKDIFVHFSAIQDRGNGRRTLKEGDLVSFNEEQTEKGLQASNVKKL